MGDSTHPLHRRLHHRPLSQSTDKSSHLTQNMTNPPLPKNLEPKKPQEPFSHKIASWSKSALSGLEKVGAALGMAALGGLAVVLFPITIPGYALMKSAVNDMDRSIMHKLGDAGKAQFDRAENKMLWGRMLGFPLVGINDLSKVFDSPKELS